MDVRNVRWFISLVLAAVALAVVSGLAWVIQTTQALPLAALLLVVAALLHASLTLLWARSRGGLRFPGVVLATLDLSCVFLLFFAGIPHSPAGDRPLYPGQAWQLALFGFVATGVLVLVASLIRPARVRAVNPRS